jgi:3-phosphoshikimate 1-carboxyvinyltransferase
MAVGGSVRVPGDKSITHRALLLAALAPGLTRIRRPLTSLDARSSARILRQLGADIGPLREGADLSVRGSGRFRRPAAALNCGNSGTTARLVMGLLAAHPFQTVLTGDASLRRRPMRRVTEPLGAMGARFEGRDPDRLPLIVHGQGLRPLSWELPVSSAQLKSAILLAGLAGGVPVRVREPAGMSRDHTERMLRAFGFTVLEDDGWIKFEPDAALRPFDLEIPGDPSSAAFLVGTAVMADQGELRIAGVGVNPTRTGFLDVLGRMGARVLQEAGTERWGEPVADLIARPAHLTATEVTAQEIPGLIDEIPLLAVLASRAGGTTVFREVGELRVKESDRLELIADNLVAVGGKAIARDNTLIVEGTGLTPRGPVRTEGDHRIAMAFAVLGTVPGADIRIDDLGCAAVSFPGFVETLRRVTIRRAA